MAFYDNAIVIREMVVSDFVAFRLGLYFGTCGTCPCPRCLAGLGLLMARGPARCWDLVLRELNIWASSCQKINSTVGCWGMWGTHWSNKYVCVCIYIYIWHSVPTPSGHGHVSAIVLSPFPPVVWWGCGTVPLPLWCGRGVVLSPLPPCSVCMTIYMTWWVQWVWYVIISCTMEHSDAAQAYITTLAVAQCFWTHR